MPDILGYARVSTADQDIAGQCMRLEEAGPRVQRRHFRQKHVAPGSAELIACARLRERHMGSLHVEEKIDTSPAAGEPIFHLFAAIAHFERRLISERTRVAIAAARAKGKLPGRQPLDGEKVSAALKLIAASVSPAEAARQLSIGRSVYREMKRLGVARRHRTAASWKYKNPTIPNEHENEALH